MYRLHERMQQLFRDWRELEKEIGPYRGRHRLPCRCCSATFAVARQFDDDELREELRHERECAEAMAVAIFHHAAEAVLDEKPGPRAARSTPTR